MCGGNLLVAVCVSWILCWVTLAETEAFYKIILEERTTAVQMYADALILILFAYAVKTTSEGYSMFCHMYVHCCWCCLHWSKKLTACAGYTPILSSMKNLHSCLHQHISWGACQASCISDTISFQNSLKWSSTGRIELQFSSLTNCTLAIKFLMTTTTTANQWVW